MYRLLTRIVIPCIDFPPPTITIITYYRLLVHLKYSGHFDKYLIPYLFIIDVFNFTINHISYYIEKNR